jgi:hypothetical protein
MMQPPDPSTIGRAAGLAEHCLLLALIEAVTAIHPDPKAMRKRILDLAIEKVKSAPEMRELGETSVPEIKFHAAQMIRILVDETAHGKGPPQGNERRN